MMLVELEESKKRFSGYIREKIDAYVVDELVDLRPGARSDKIRDLMYCAPTEFIFDTHVWDECLNKWLLMDTETRDEWLEYEKERRDEECEE